MSELRVDDLTGRHVLLAPGRAARPHTVARVTADQPVAPPTDCPFCPGHEDRTPPEVCRTGDGEPDTPGWRVRVVPNLYPIVGGVGSPTSARGAHEVVILHPDHSRDVGRLDDDAAIEVFSVLQARARTHAAAGFAHNQVLVNQGRAAGASIAHPHAQVLAIEAVPPAVADALERFATAGADLVAADALLARARGTEIFGGDVAAWAPWAGSSPYETRIAASAAGARFEDASDAIVAGVALATRDIVAALRAVSGDVAYNVVVHNAPTRATVEGVGFHWYTTVLPRVATAAGFELGTGLYVNTVDPTDAAAALREALAGSSAG